MVWRKPLSKKYRPMMPLAKIHIKQCLPEMDLFAEDDISMNIWVSLQSPFSEHTALSMAIWQKILKRSCEISAYSALH